MSVEISAVRAPTRGTPDRDRLAGRIDVLASDGVTEPARQPGGDAADALRTPVAAVSSAGLLPSPDGS